MQIRSPAFENNQRIPDQFTCQGENVNPPLVIANVPPQAKTLVLIIEDPDAPIGTWDHWLVVNIDPTTREIPISSVPPGSTQITNSFGQVEYGGPCPPPGPVHRYFFKLFALDTPIDAEKVNDKNGLIYTMENHVLAQAELVGTYSR